MLSSENINFFQKVYTLKYKIQNRETTFFKIRVKGQALLWISKKVHMEEDWGLLIINPKQDLLSSEAEQEDTIYMFFLLSKQGVSPSDKLRVPATAMKEHHVFLIIKPQSNKLWQKELTPQEKFIRFKYLHWKHSKLTPSENIIHCSTTEELKINFLLSVFS